MNAGSNVMVSGTVMTYQEVITLFIWNTVVFVTCCLISCYILAFFGFIKSPAPAGNVTEHASQNFSGFGNLLKEGTLLARTINKSIAESVNEPPPANK